MTDAAAHRELATLMTALREGVLAASKADRLAELLASDESLRDAYVELTWLWAELELSAEGAAGEPGDADAYPIRPTRPTSGLLLAASVVLLGVAAAVWLVAIGGSTPPGDRLVNPPIATLVFTDTTVVSDTSGVLNAGDAIEPQWVRTEGGATELVLTSGAQVELSGRCEMKLAGPTRVAMRRGLATFDCPSSARGFTVELPGGASVTDLGTRFSVQIDGESGHGEVRVIEGRVSLAGPDGSAVASAGSGWRFDANSRFTRMGGDAGAIVITSDDADGAIYRYADGRTGRFKPQDLIVGTATGPANYNGIAFFRLPDPHALDGARVTLTLTAIAGGALTGANVDAWGLGYVSGTPNLDASWLSTDPNGQPAGAIRGNGEPATREPMLLCDDIVPAGFAVAVGWSWTSNATQSEALASYLRGLYARGARAGDWAVIRLSPDADTLAAHDGAPGRPFQSIRFGGSHRTDPDQRAAIRITQPTPPAAGDTRTDPTRTPIQTGDDR